MIQTVFRLHCDGCNELVGWHEDEDVYPVFGSASEAWQHARLEGWFTDGLKHYCPSCWTDKRKAAADAARAAAAGAQRARAQIERAGT